MAPVQPPERAAGFFALRTPLLPFEELLRLGEGLKAPSCLDQPDAELAAALAADRRVFRERLRALLARPEVIEAVFLASPDLVESLPAWETDPDSERGLRVERSLLRYLTRAATRATPFGLLAGCSSGEVAAETDLRLGPVEGYRRHTRLDMGYLAAVVDKAVEDPAVRLGMRYRPNSSLYEVAGRFHYVEARLEGSLRHYSLAAAEVSPYLEAALAAARTGATPREIAAALADDEVSLEEAEEFVGELIAGQFLLPELALGVTGEAPDQALAEELAGLPGCAGAALRLREANARLRELDARGPGAAIRSYLELAEGLAPLSIPIELNHLVQVDMTKPAPGLILGAGPVRTLLEGLETFRQITPFEDPLRDFTAAFLERYERREIPLAEALDDEAGIGLPRPGSRPGGASTAQPRVAVLAELVLRASERREREVVLTKEDLERLERRDAPPLPDTIAVAATLAARSREAVAAGDYRLVWHGTFGPPGALLFGRFCHADPLLREHVESYVRAEEAQAPDAVFAEVVHLPQGRIGNILCRPRLRDHEIPYLGRSGAPEERQIPVSDLLVSVVDGRVVLRSRRLGRRVVPRLISAHNFRHESQLPVYRFLGMVQAQQTASGLMWDWGPLISLPFLPRVSHGRLVLSRALWNLSGEELRRLAGRTREGLYRAVQEWRAERGLPRFVVLASDDHQLPVDLDSEAGIEVLLLLARRQKSALLVELLPGPEELCCEGPEGRFHHELIVPILKGRAAGRGTALPRPVETPVQRRSFALGSEWLYVKLYTGTALIDLMLREAVPGLLERIHGLDAVDRWFFVRYADPQPHLRLRFHGDPGRLREQVLPLLAEETAGWLAEKLLWKVDYDTYEREVERYGGEDGMLLAEELFHRDSEAVLRLLGLPEGADEDARRLLALRSLDALFSDLGFEPRERIEVLRSVTAAATPKDRSVWGDRYRPLRETIAEALREPLTDAARIFAERSERLAGMARNLRGEESQGRLARPVPELLVSYHHMHLNRLLRPIHNSPAEAMLYDFLRRHYQSVLARRGGLAG